MLFNATFQLLPRTVANALKAGTAVAPELYDSATISFVDIVGFTNLCWQSSPFQIVELLNEMFSAFDALIEQHDVYKVETIGDAYMCVSGLPNKNGHHHVLEIAKVTLGFIEVRNGRPEHDNFRRPRRSNARIWARRIRSASAAA